MTPYVPSIRDPGAPDVLIKILQWRRCIALKRKNSSRTSPLNGYTGQSDPQLKSVNVNARFVSFVVR